MKSLSAYMMWCSKCGASLRYHINGNPSVVKSNQIFEITCVSLAFYNMNISGRSSNCERFPGHGVIRYQRESFKCEIWRSSKCREAYTRNLLFFKKIFQMIVRRYMYLNVYIYYIYISYVYNKINIHTYIYIYMCVCVRNVWTDVKLRWPLILLYNILLLQGITVVPGGSVINEDTSPGPV